MFRRPGRVRHSLRGGYVWKRPNGESVRLHNFARSDVKTLQPTFKNIDRSLKKDVKLHAKFVKASGGEVKGQYKKYYGSSPFVKVGALTYPHAHRKSKVVVNDQIFKNRSYYQPGGVISHEIGHLAQLNKSNRIQKQWEKKATPQRGVRSRQFVNPKEDFAESFRTSLNQPLTRREHTFFKVAVNQSRADHLQKHYLKR